jgi:hypothetical protein
MGHAIKGNLSRAMLDEDPHINTTATIKMLLGVTSITLSIHAILHNNRSNLCEL